MPIWEKKEKKVDYISAIEYIIKHRFSAFWHLKCFMKVNLSDAKEYEDPSLPYKF